MAVLVQVTQLFKSCTMKIYYLQKKEKTIILKVIVLAGLILTCSFIYSQDSTAYHQNGAKSFERRYSDKGNLVMRWYYDDTQLMQEIIYTDSKNATQTHYYDDGRLMGSGKLRKGEEYGLWTYYYRDGKVMKTGEYGFIKNLKIKSRNRNRYGEYKTESYTGKVYDGKWKIFDETGKLKQLSKYRKGKLRLDVTYDQNGNIKERKRYHCLFEECPTCHFSAAHFKTNSNGIWDSF